MADDPRDPRNCGFNWPESLQIEPDAPGRLPWGAIVALLLLGAAIGALVG